MPSGSSVQLAQNEEKRVERDELNLNSTSEALPSHRCHVA